MHETPCRIKRPALPKTGRSTGRGGHAAGTDIRAHGGARSAHLHRAGLRARPRRFRAVFGGRATRDDFKFGESPAVPGDVSIPNRNFMNLLELPVLFYVAGLMY